MTVLRRPRVLRSAAVLLAAALLLAAGAVLAQNNLPATEGGDRSVSENSTSEPDGAVRQTNQPDGDPAGTETGEAAEFISPQGYVDGMAPDDNVSLAPSSLAPNQPALTFSYYTVSGPEMQPRTTSSLQTYSSNGCVYMSSGSSTGLLTGTGLHIRDDSIIKYIRLYYYDTNAAAGVDAFLTRYAPGSATSDRVSTGSTNAYNAGYGFVVSSEITETVNNTSYAYMLYGWPDSASSTLRVCGIRVAYYAPSITSVYLPTLPR